uniref:F-box domain-containing protein n=1 Tax=Moniliophthora roreri TaxID=221103 RepID=A0A0W0FQ36_MONRR
MGKPPESTDTDTWDLLSYLPFCPSRDDIAREDYYQMDSAMPGSEVEPFVLDDDDWGRVETLVRVRDSKALCNAWLSTNLPFQPGENPDSPFEVGASRLREVPFRNYMCEDVRNRVHRGLGRRKRVRNLSMLLIEMPEEIVALTFGFTHPVDLYTLCRVNQTFRKFLLSWASVSVWQQSFHSSSDPIMPACPPDIHGFNWARLFFGSSSCDCCTFTSSAEPDFALRQRLCYNCKWNRITFPDEDNIEQISLVHDYTVKTYDDGVPDEFAEPTLLVDLGDVLREYIIRREAVDKSVNGAEGAFMEWKKSRRALVEAYNKQIVECQHWYIQTKKEYTEATERRKKRFFARLRLDDPVSLALTYVYVVYSRLQSHLAKEGFDRVDILSVEDVLMSLREDFWPEWINAGYYRTLRITRRKWKEIRYEYVPIVEREREHRLERERRILVEKRTTVAEDTIRNHKKTTRPKLWPYWPPISLIRESISFLQELITSPTDKSITEQDCAEAIPFIMPTVEDRINMLKEQCRNLVHLARTTDTASNVDVLSLATSVFSCCYGEDDGCIWADDGLFRFNVLGSEAASSLIRTLNLDPHSTLAEELDSRIDRFLCLACPEGVRRRPVFNWREAVAHVVDAGHKQLKWCTFSPEVTSIIQKHEHDSIFGRDVWCCNHCPAHMESQVGRWAVMWHAKQEHGIARSRRDIDYFYFAPALHGRPSRKLSSINITNGGLYSCNHCNRASTSLLNEKGIKMHMRDKHNVSDPSDPSDYRCMWAGIATGNLNGLSQRTYTIQ